MSLLKSCIFVQTLDSTNQDETCTFVASYSNIIPSFKIEKKRQWMKVWLGGPTRNTLKGQSRNKHWPNNILGPFSIFFSSCLFIACQNIWLEVSITILKRWKSLQICIPYWCGLFRNQVLKLWKFITKLYLLK